MDFPKFIGAAIILWIAIGIVGTVWPEYQTPFIIVTLLSIAIMTGAIPRIANLVGQLIK